MGEEIKLQTVEIFYPGSHSWHVVRLDLNQAYSGMHTINFHVVILPPQTD